ncbi:MAG: hypothetical protein NVSMB20_23120 [Bradyrhizobium sp.]
MRDGVAKAFLNSGHTCSALTRMIVPRSRLAEVEDLAAAAAATCTMGDPLAQGTRLGPVASAAQRDRVRGYIRAGMASGAKLLAGGPDTPAGLDRGLAAGVWSADPDRALRVARRLRAGQVEVNGGPFNPIAPFGGYKQSGNGRELGRFGMEEFLEVKSLQL